MELEGGGECDSWGNLAARKLVYTLVFDYVFYESWQEFSREFTVDSETNREFISGLMLKVGPNCDNLDTLTKSHLLHLLVLLCDSKTSLSENGEGPTYLERALTCLESVDLKETRKLSKMIKLQAVIACCREGNWDLAKAVYQRLWPNGHNDLSSEQKILQSILHGKNGAQLLQKCMTYDEFLQQTRESLQTFVDSFGVPLLLSAGQRLAERDQELSSQGTWEDEDEDFDTANELTQESRESEAGAPEVVENDNNNNKMEVVKSPELEQRVTRSRQKSQETNDTNHRQLDNDAENGDLQVSQVEVPKRNLRSRTISAKTQIILKEPKKTTTRERHDTSKEDENMELGDFEQEGSSLVMDLEGVAEPTDADGDVEQGNSKGDEIGKRDQSESLRAKENNRVGNTRKSKRGAIRYLGDGKSRQEAEQSGGEAGEEGDILAVEKSPARGSERDSRESADGVGCQEVERQEVTREAKYGSRRGNRANDGDALGNDAEESGVEEMEASQTNGSLLVEESDEDEWVPDPSNVTIPKMLLWNAFDKMGYGHKFREDVERCLASLPKRLANHNQNKKRKISSRSSEDGPDIPTATSTPAKRNLKDFFVAPNPVSKKGRSQLQETAPSVAGPSGVSIGQLPGSFYRQRKTKLRDLERACDEEEEAGEQVVFSSEGESSDDDDLESIISKASLKSPKIRKSLQPPSRPLRKPWTNDEVRLLIRGIKKFGVGRWAEIKNYFEFEGRTNVNLKDKWRQLQKLHNTSSPSKMNL